MVGWVGGWLWCGVVWCDEGWERELGIGRRMRGGRDVCWWMGWVVSAKGRGGRWRLELSWLYCTVGYGWIWGVWSGACCVLCCGAVVVVGLCL